MDLPSEERRVLYGLRERSSGRMLRVAHRVEHYGDEEHGYTEDLYTLALDQDRPLFDAGSPEALARVFVPTRGRSPAHPMPGPFRPGDVEPVALEEVLARTLAPAAVAFEVPVTVPTPGVFDMHRRYAAKIPGLAEVLDAVAEARADLEIQMQPGGRYDWGKFQVVGYPVEAPGSMPDDAVGRLFAMDRSDVGGRRILAVLPWDAAPDSGRPGVAYRGLVLCLSDARGLTPGLAHALAVLRDPPAPAPR